MKKYFKRGLGVIGAGIVIGSIPNISGTASETTMKTNAMTGLGNIANTFPTQGKLIGTGMVLKQIGTGMVLKQVGRLREAKRRLRR